MKEALSARAIQLEVFMSQNGMKRRIGIDLFAALVLLAVTLPARPATATSYISVEPIPSVEIVGDSDLNKIQSIGFANLELWSNRLLNDCQIVDNVIDTLKANGAISTVESSNTKFLVAAGGFEGLTNPSYVFTIQDSGSNAVTQADVDVLSNALGYVLNQSGTAHFSPGNPKAYAFSLDYAVVTFAGTLTGEEANEFFEFLGTINPALFSGVFAGFTQIDFQNSSTNNSMLFLKPAASKQKLIAGLSAAASDTPGAIYETLNRNGRPTTAKAGVAFPGNDWIAFPAGDEYLAIFNNPSAGLLDALAGLRQQHRQAVEDLLNAINNNVGAYLGNQFECPQ
ncbi:MAG: hypothetical protein ACREQW_02780 [Candidatus Binatia bacterium]